MSTLSTKPVRNEDRRSQRTIPFIPPPSRETSFQHTYVTLYNTVVSLGPSPSRGPISEDWKGKFVGLFKRHFLLSLGPRRIIIVLQRWIMRCPNQMRRAHTYRRRCWRRKETKSRLRIPIRIVIRAISRTPDRERKGEWAKRKLFMRPAAVYAVSFESNSWFPRSMLARYVDGWIRAICTKHSRRIDNSHDRRDESAGITLRDEFASVNLARISQTRDTYTLTVIESSMRRITLSNYTHGNFLFRPPSTLS